jgi:membrane protein
MGIGMVSEMVSDRNHSPRATRGREARKPSDIPPSGWLDIVLRVKEQISTDNVSILAAGLALYSLLAIFPALAAIVLLYGLVSSPGEIAEQIRSFQGLVPPEGLAILEQQLRTLASQQDEALGIGLAVAIAIALWSARKGMVALITAANIAYNERERRGFFQRLYVSLAFTVAAVLAFILVVALGVIVPIAVSYLPLGRAAGTVLLIVRWILLWALAVFGLTIVYRYAPARSVAQWPWVRWGSVFAATLWLAGSLLFALYVRKFGASYGETYGALGGVVVMLLWLLFTSYVVILGAELNSEMERQTRYDTTVGPERPMGERGAYSADTIGPTRSGDC